MLFIVSVSVISSVSVLPCLIAELFLDRVLPSQCLADASRQDFRSNVSAASTFVVRDNSQLWIGTALQTLIQH